VINIIPYIVHKVNVLYRFYHVQKVPKYAKIELRIRRFFIYASTKKDP
jgi:hypothetical protein